MVEEEGGGGGGSTGEEEEERKENEEVIKAQLVDFQVTLSVLYYLLSLTVKSSFTQSLFLLLFTILHFQIT